MGGTGWFGARLARWRWVRFGRRSVVVLAAVLLVALAGCGGDDGPGRKGELRDGGTAAFERELKRLRGRPVVVNQWASWCPPCRQEFPFFRQLAERYRGRVAFLGVNSQDVRSEAEEFLGEFPTPFPHFWDPDAEIARVFKGGLSWPTTAFYTASGTLNFTHQGSYASAADLDEDIRRWASRKR